MLLLAGTSSNCEGGRIKSAKNGSADAVQAAEYRRCALNNSLVMKNNTIVVLKRGVVASRTASARSGNGAARSVVSKRPEMSIPAAGAVQPTEYRP